MRDNFFMSYICMYTIFATKGLMWIHIIPDLRKFVVLLQFIYWVILFYVWLYPPLLNYACESRKCDSILRRYIFSVSKVYPPLSWQSISIMIEEKLTFIEKQKYCLSCLLIFAKFVCFKDSKDDSTNSILSNCRRVTTPKYFFQKKSWCKHE